LKKVLVTCFLFVAILFSGLFIPSHLAFCDDASDSLSTPAKVKAPKKAKKKIKKAKATKLKVSKTSAGAQDEVSDQADVSQQADSAGNKKKR
jgi:hypothetical protein